MSQVNLKDIIKREYLKCVEDPIHFMRKYCTIQHPQKVKIKLYNELVKQVKPKWYENKWLWFTIGIFTTATAVHLAGQID